MEKTLSRRTVNRPQSNFLLGRIGQKWCAWSLLFLALPVAAQAYLADAYESDNTASSAKIIRNQQIQNHNIHLIGDVDWVKFKVGGFGAKSVRIETSGVGGDTHVWLFGPNSETQCIAHDDNSGTGTFSLINVGPLAPGLYCVKIMEHGNNAGIPAYKLKVSWTTSSGGALDSYEYDDVPLWANAIANGQTQNRSIQAGNTDWLRFTVGAAGGRNLRLETAGITATATGDTELWLFGPGNASELVASDDDSGAGKFSLIQRSSLSPGTYYVKIREYGNDAPISAYRVRAAWSTTPIAPTNGQWPAEITGPIKWLHTDVSSWPVTASLTASVDGGWIRFPYSKSTVWPAVNGVNANPWVIVKWTDGRWYAATFEWLRFGQTSKPVGVLDGSRGDHIKKPPLSNWRPHSGERFGIMVSGLARDGTRNVIERSNVVMVTWP